MSDECELGMHSMCTLHDCDCTCHQETNDPDDELPARGTIEDDDDDEDVYVGYEPVYEQDE